MHTSNSWDFSKNYNIKIKVLENILLTEENETALTLNELCYLLLIQLYIYTQMVLLELYTAMDFNQPWIKWNTFQVI